MDIMVSRVNKKDKDGVLSTKFWKHLKRNLEKKNHTKLICKRIILILVIDFCLTMLYIYEITLELWMEEIPNMNIATYSHVTIFNLVSVEAVKVFH